MSYKKNRTESKPLTLSDGTEVYEISESFSVNSLIDISFSRSRPVRSRHQAEIVKLDSHIVEEPINTELAKLSYIGCTLTAPDAAINKSIQRTFNESRNQLYREQSKRALSRQQQSPYAAYHALLRQLTEFASDLQQYDASTTDDPVEKANIKLITQGIKHLNATLAALSEDSEYKAILDQNYAPFTHADSSLHATINNICNGHQTTDNEKGGGDAQRDKAEEKDSWQLFAKNKTRKTMGTSDAQYLDLETRISKLEDSIGFVTDMKNPYPDTLNAVDLLEARFEYVFGSSWVKIKQQANQMMNDLKNIKYHLDLMQARYKPTEKQTRMEWEKLEDLWIMMNKWDTVVFELVNIVKRLRSLQNYHYRTCLFIERVNKLYNQQCFIYQALKNDEKVLQKCVQSMEENTKQLQQNSDYLIQRLNVIDAKLK